MRIRLSILKLLTVLAFFPGCLSLAALTDSSGGDESALALLPALGLGSLGGGTGSATASSEAVTVSGTLTDGDSGLPLSGAEVVFDDGTRSPGAQLTRSITNTSGRWAYEIDVPAGTEVRLSAIIVHGGGQVGRFVIIVTVNANDVVFELVSVQGNVRITITVVRPGDNAADVTPPSAPYLNPDGLIGRNSFIFRANGSNFDDVTADEDLIFEFYVKDNQADAEGGPGINPEYVFVGPPTTVFGDHHFELTNLPYGKAQYTKMYVIDEAGNRSSAARAGNNWFTTFPADDYLGFTGASGGFLAYVDGLPSFAGCTVRYGGYSMKGDIVFGNDTLVNIYGQRSPDGCLWTAPLSLPVAWNPQAITFGENKFVAVGDAGLRLHYDGNAYTNATISGGPDLNDVVYGDGVFVAVGDDGRRVRSEDGVTWTNDQTAGVSTLCDFKSVAYGDGVFVASGGKCTVRSTDGGQTWADYIVHSSTLGSVAYGNGRFVLSAGSRTYVSTDGGQTWSDPGYNNLDRPYYGKMEFAGGRFVLAEIGTYYSRVVVSTDGVLWFDLHVNLRETPAGIVFIDKD